MAVASEVRERVIALYNDGTSVQAIARDNAVWPAFGDASTKPSSLAWKVWQFVRALVAEGTLERRADRRGDSLAEAVQEIGESPLAAHLGDERTAFERHRGGYERLIGLVHYENPQILAKRGPFDEAVIFSDPHLPHERMDLIARIAEEHQGRDCYLAGDVHDWKQFSKYLDCWSADREEDVVDVLGKTEAFLDVLCAKFRHVYVMWGNHDTRPLKKAVAALGDQFQFITQRFLAYMYERRPNLTMITNQVTTPAGRAVPGLHFYWQLGDCVMGHVERHGIRGRGAELAHDFYFAHKEILGLSPFNVVLQAHTHHSSYFRHKLTRAHCYEIGCMTDVPDYALHTQRYDPPQHGWFHLVQKDGVTDINRSKLWIYD